MKKLALTLDSLRVETFATDAGEAGLGTVLGAEATNGKTCNCPTQFASCNTCALALPRHRGGAYEQVGPTYDFGCQAC